MGVLAVISKEISLLIRDKIGLLILFILPIFLLIIVSLTQQNMNSPEKSIKVLLINKDTGKIGERIAKHIINNATFTIKQYAITKKNTEEKAQQEVAKGNYNALIIINKNLTQDLQKNMQQLSRKGRQAKIMLNSVALVTDPAMPPSVSQTLETGIKLLMQSVQLTATQNIVLRTRHLSGKKVKQWFVLKKEYAQTTKNSPIIQPNSVQQNAPAWTLFGMFFIVIPLAGVMVRERSMGVIQRIRIAPVPQIIHLVGRVLCYFVLNMMQMSLMLLVAVYLLPSFNLPALNVLGHLGAIYVVGACASLAAIGFGLLIGVYATSAQQATIFAPFLIVIVAAVSGIFMPMYLMPKALTYISAFSPLYWAQSAFVDIFVRNIGFSALWPNLLKLLGFFVIMLALALLPFTKLVAQKKVSH